MCRRIATGVITGEKIEEVFMALDSELLSILACPGCKGKVRLGDEGDGIICDRCWLLFPIRDGIPTMLVDEAIRLDD